MLREDAINKVKLLLALTKSPNTNEAANAQTLADKLIAKYELQEPEYKLDQRHGDAMSTTNRYRVSGQRCKVADLLKEFLVSAIEVMSPFSPSSLDVRVDIDKTDAELFLDMASEFDCFVHYD